MDINEILKTSSGIGPPVRLAYYIDSFAGKLGWSFTLTEPGFIWTSGPFDSLKDAKRDAETHLKESAAPVEVVVTDKINFDKLKARIAQLDNELNQLKKEINNSTAL